MAFLYLPVLFLVLFSFNDRRTVGLPFEGFTLDWYDQALGNARLLDAVFEHDRRGGRRGCAGHDHRDHGRVPAGPRQTSATRELHGVVATMPIMFPGMLLGIGILIFLRRVLDLRFAAHRAVAATWCSRRRSSS